MKDVLVGGKPLEKEKVYTLAGTEFVLRNGGDGNTLFRTLPLQRESMLTEADAIRLVIIIFFISKMIFSCL